jgi:hypothetical protein
VKILRPESYWYNQTGKVVSVDQVGCAAVAYLGPRGRGQGQDGEAQQGNPDAPSAHGARAYGGARCRTRPNLAGATPPDRGRLSPPPTPCCTRCARPQSGIKYPVVVRFETQNYAGVTTNNFALDEVESPKK